MMLIHALIDADFPVSFLNYLSFFVRITTEKSERNRKIDDVIVVYRHLLYEHQVEVSLVQGERKVIVVDHVPNQTV